MGFVIVLLTLVFVVVCLILVFLVLLQLPKKEAGAGLAFGAGTTDALFGAGSGNVLTKITKYSAAAFFILSIILSVMQSIYHGRDASSFATALTQAPAPATQSSPATRTPSPAPAVIPMTSGSNSIPLISPIEATNLPGNVLSTNIVPPTNSVQK